MLRIILSPDDQGIFLFSHCCGKCHFLYIPAPGIPHNKKLACIKKTRYKASERVSLPLLIISGIRAHLTNQKSMRALKSLSTTSI
ncbi:hypothetical protein BvCmsNSNP012_05004 [Escherichia coli]|nr:hypothetical protein BvCmsNSNP012_05004 [Escherichia coli]